MSVHSSKLCRDQAVLKVENKKHSYHTHIPSMFSINNTSHTAFPLTFFLFDHHLVRKTHVVQKQKKSCQVLNVERSECRIKLELFTAVSKLKLPKEFKYCQILRKGKKNGESKTEDGKRFKLISSSQISETGNRSKLIHVYRAP